MNKRRLRLGFAGTPKLAACFLHDLLGWEAVQVLLVCTRPDRYQGRKARGKSFGPVKELAVSHGLPVLQPECAAHLAPEALRDLDVLLVVAYGLLLPAAVLRAPHLACVNVHFSLLPRWRGAAPVAHALLAGDEETGISLFQMTERLDAGPLLHQESCRVSARDTTGSLEQRLVALGLPCVRESLLTLRDGNARPRPQEQGHASYAPRLDKKQFRLDWKQPAALLERQVRACHPRPGAYLDLECGRLKVHRAVVRAGAARGTPGQVLYSGNDGVDIVAGDGAILRLLEVQPAGRRVMSAAAFRHGWGRCLERSRTLPG